MGYIVIFKGRISSMLEACQTYARRYVQRMQIMEDGMANARSPSCKSDNSSTLENESTEELQAASSARCLLQVQLSDIGCEFDQLQEMAQAAFATDSDSSEEIPQAKLARKRTVRKFVSMVSGGMWGWRKRLMRQRSW